jgi:excisionase family DNA binding protein
MKKQGGRRQHRTRVRGPVVKPPSPIGLERAFTVDQIAQTGVACRAKLYQDIKAGRLKAIKFGRSTRITESAYRAYLESAPTL